MKNVVFALMLMISTYVFAQEAALIFRTGDKEVETHLNDVEVYAAADIAVFRDDLRVQFKATNADMDRYLIKEKIHPADVYYGYVLSRTTGKPVSTVMRLHKEKKGWGAVAQELGIKPGSDQFHQLKNNTFKYIDRDKIKSKKVKTIKADKNKKEKKAVGKTSGKKIKKSDVKQKKSSSEKTKNQSNGTVDQQKKTNKK